MDDDLLERLRHGDMCLCAIGEEGSVVHRRWCQTTARRDAIDRIKGLERKLASKKPADIGMVCLRMEKDIGWVWREATE